MFLYACLILLPAAALAVCDNDNVWLFFYLVDTDNSDGLNRTEDYAIFHALDINDDLIVTRQEAEEKGQMLAQHSKEHFEGLYNFLDVDKDGVISYCDVEKAFAIVDKNKDGIRSRSEYERHLKKLCGGTIQNKVDKDYEIVSS